MIFNSFSFAAFFAVVYGLYVLSMPRFRMQNLLLLVASSFFYGCWDWRFLSLLWISTGADYLCARLLDRRMPAGATEDPAGSVEPYRYSPGVRKCVLGASLATNLGILGFFKYFDFFAQGLGDLLTSVGLPLQPRLLHLILPVGISFYTFQTLSYTIDVYRGQLRAVRSLLDFGVFVAFFPQLVAGPILRARDFLPQVCRPRRLVPEQVYQGAYLILWGLFKKVVVADNLAILVDRVFEQEPGGQYGGAVLVACYAFAVQVYCDFSGYSDIARGCARMMGFDFPANFNLPYFSSNPVEFWRRWHISLSTWLRDYLYIPLGGNRRGLRRTCINLMITMGLGGLWHGAGWTFFLWGAYQGGLLVGYKLIEPFLRRAADRPLVLPRSLVKAMTVAVFFHLVCLGWLIFRSQSLTQVAQMLGDVATPWPWWILCGANTLAGTGLPTLLLYACPLILMELIQRLKNDTEVLLRAPAFARGLAYAALFYGLVLLGAPDGKPFIYFQF